MEATSTLADALLDDLDDLSDAAEEDEVNEEKELTEATATDSTKECDWWPRHQKRLLSDPSLHAHLKTIGSTAKEERVSNEEADHKLLVLSNQFLISAANDLTTAHTALCTAYEPKFPELEELIPDSTQYVKAVRIIGNETDLTSRLVNDGLNEFLSNHQIITLSVAGSTTAGRLLDEDELRRVDEIASYMEEIMKVRDQLSSYIEQHMESLAPSVVALIGAPTASKLLALTGGLAALSKIPSCNLQVLGQVKQNRSGSVAALSGQQQAHQGVLVQTELVQRCPRHLRQKALKTVAAKLALAIRCDYVNVNSGRPRLAAAGRAFREQIEAKFVKLQEPDKAPILKALPKPDLTVKKRRGGKRMRRIKEQYEETALMKQANTRAFSEQAGEYGDDAMGKSLGMLDTTMESGGALRKNTAEIKKMKYANTRASRKKAAQMAAASSNSNGLASSMVFTPVQGMELVNPDASKDRVKEANRRWFSDSAGFQSALLPKK